MQIDKKSPLPVYCQLKNLIVAKIKTGEFLPHQPIPSERILSENLGVSRMTIRQALNQLVAENVLYREKGKGTFVAKAKIEQRNIMSFSEMVQTKGLTPVTQVLFFAKNPAPPEVVHWLALDAGSPVYQIRRLRLANQLPIGIEEVFIPEQYCPNLEQLDLTASLYQGIRQTYGLTISYMDNQIEATQPTKPEKELLRITAATPVLRISGVSFNHAGLAILYERSVYRADEYTYSARIYFNQNME